MGMNLDEFLREEDPDEVKQLRADRQAMMDTKSQEGRLVMELGANVKRLEALVSELLENKGRLEQMEEDFQPGLPERRLADDLLDAIRTYEAAEAERKTDG